MEARLFMIHGSHPCATVERALQLKGVAYKTVELSPPLHAPIQRLLFGERTVPGLRMDGEKLVGSRRILHRLDELRPEPPLYPSDPERRRRVEEIEAWGDETFQSVPRRLLWSALRRHPDALLTYAEHSKLKLPAPMVRASAPLIARSSARLNRATDEAAQADLAELPGHLDKVDGWIEEGLMGGDEPNAADLQIAPTLRLLMTMEDVRPQIEDRPCGRLALRLFPEVDGRLPAGALAA